MTNRMDNLQIVFDRTDWRSFRLQIAALRRFQDPFFDALADYLDAIKTAAKMDGYQTEKEPTQ